MPHPYHTLDTPYGRLLVWATSGDHVGFSTVHVHNRDSWSYRDVEGIADTTPTVKLSRVEYYLRLDVHPTSFETDNVTKSGWGWEILSPDWKTPREGFIRALSRADTALSYGTDAADKELKAKLIPVLLEWLETTEAKRMLTEARLAKVTATMAEKRATADKLRADLAECERELELIGVEIEAMEA